MQGLYYICIWRKQTNQKNEHNLSAQDFWIEDVHQLSTGQQSACKTEKLSYRHYLSGLVTRTGDGIMLWDTSYCRHKSLHTPIKMAGFCDVKMKIIRVRSFM